MTDSAKGVYSLHAMRFEWDDAKAEANRKKHGVSFEEATVLFTGHTNYLEIYKEQQRFEQFERERE